MVCIGMKLLCVKFFLESKIFKKSMIKRFSQVGLICERRLRVNIFQKFILSNDIFESGPYIRAMENCGPIDLTQQTYKIHFLSLTLTPSKNVMFIRSLK